MSILLEALRKTEKHQQQQVPTIHGDEQGRREPETLKTGPLVAMIAVALAVSGWFTWRQYELPQGIYQPPVTLTAEQSRGAQSNSDEAPVSAQQQQAKTENKPATAPPKPVAGRNQNQDRTPVESFQAPAGSGSGSGQASASLNNHPGSGSTAGTNTANSDAGSAINPNNQRPVRPSATNDEGAKQATAHIPEPIGYWELPDAVRASVPEIRFSVLVYDKVPANRFVLVDGQRLAEGDSVQPGLLVDEIRRDGVILSYRLYKFLVKR